MIVWFLNDTFHCLYDFPDLLMVVMSSQVLLDNWIQGVSQLMRNSGINHLQKLVSALRILVHNVLCLVDHLNQAVLFPKHPIIFRFDFDVFVWRKFSFVFIILMFNFRGVLIYWNHLKDNMIQYMWLYLSNFAHWETSLIFDNFIKIEVHSLIFGLFWQIYNVFDNLVFVILLLF
jgi:hypothetical protein